MTDQWQEYAKRFNAQTLRERALIAGAALIALGFVWWVYYAEPMMQKIAAKRVENQRIEGEIDNSRIIVDSIRHRIASGVHVEKEAQLAQLIDELNKVETNLQVTTIELVDPEKMFQLMNQLVYRDSRLKLLSLKRREVRPAIPVADDEESTQEPSIYRHLLEIEFEGSYFNILRYMQSLETLDWKLLWDEIEILRQDESPLTVKLVISTLSTRKEWVGI